ncbi:MAG TPA: hypothetical protein DDW42_05775 [Desulfobacteraceae bacterium]|nr:hypothetical protein [Desulfobacteraceae bacterium]
MPWRVLLIVPVPIYTLRKTVSECKCDLILLDIEIFEPLKYGDIIFWRKLRDKMNLENFVGEETKI